MIGEPPKDEAEHLSGAPPVMAGSIAVISAKCSSMKGHYPAQGQPQ